MRTNEPARAALLRRRVQRWFAKPHFEWFVGRVVAYEEGTNAHTVEYDDGECRTEVLPLSGWSYDLLD